METFHFTENSELLFSSFSVSFLHCQAKDSGTVVRMCGRAGGCVYSCITLTVFMRKRRWKGVKKKKLKEQLCVVFLQIKVGTRVEAADGINRTALREIKLLQELSHPNIIGVSYLVSCAVQCRLNIF